jgi:Predicted nucleic acid-binding protein, contains PIN domain
MVVVDSSALIPLSWVSRLNLITATYDEIRTTEHVRDEVLTEGKRGTVALKSFLGDVSIHETPSDAKEVASLEGIAVADASVIVLADDMDAVLLANDKGLINVARSHGVECWWVTTLLLNCTKVGVLSSDEASEVLYELVDAGMNLHPKVYSQVQQKLTKLGN